MNNHFILKNVDDSIEPVISNQSNRYEIIDLLRALAIFLVVIRHVQLRIPFDQTTLLMSLPGQIFNEYINVKEFYKYRFARIAPPLIALLVILTALHFLGVKDYVIKSKFTYFETLFSALTFHLNWLEGMKGYLPGSWDVLWSLSVEEVFYLAFPVVCLLSRRKSIIYIVLIALILIGPFYRYSLEGDKVWQAKAYLSCMDSIALGCLFALVSWTKTISALTKSMFLIVGTMIVVFVLMVKKDPAFDFIGDLYLFKTILSVGVGLLLVASVRQQLAPLTHMFVVYSGVRLYKKYNVSLDYSFIWLISILIVSGLLGYIVERYFSKPMNLWIRHNDNKTVKETV